MKFLSLPFFFFSTSLFNFVEGHGYLKSPRSRNWYARQEGGRGAGSPPIEYDPNGIDKKRPDQVCGTKVQDYDDYRDMGRNPMPWIPQGVYSEGSEIDVEIHLTTNHWGHFELYVCPDGNASTQECFLRNPLTMVRDLKYNGPRDSNYPQRGYVGSGFAETYKFRYRLPNGVSGDKVLLQWRYVTSNSCLPGGYRNNSALISRGWAQLQKDDCVWPLNWTGDRPDDNKYPEQFFNCAEIRINKSGPSPPTQTPPIPPTPTPGQIGTCGNGNVGNGKCEDPGLCCSQWGWCGNSGNHCDVPPPAPVSVPAKPPTTPTGGEGQGTCGNGNIGNGKCSDSSQCCSVWGWCGTSAGHCNGGTCGNGSNGNGVCPDSKTDCCSKWGWCGTSANHCNR